MHVLLELLNAKRRFNLPLPNSLSAYADIAQDLAALATGGRRVCASRSEAMRWRHRANKFRALLREGGTTPYDHLVFKISQSEDNVVLIVPQAPAAGHLETSTGAPLAPKAEEDELMDAARALAKELGLE